MSLHRNHVSLSTYPATFSSKNSTSKIMQPEEEFVNFLHKDRILTTHRFAEGISVVGLDPVLVELMICGSTRINLCR